MAPLLLAAVLGIGAVLATRRKQVVTVPVDSSGTVQVPQQAMAAYPGVGTSFSTPMMAGVGGGAPASMPTGVPSNINQTPGQPVTVNGSPVGPAQSVGIPMVYNGPGRYTGEFTMGGGFEEVGGQWTPNPYSMGSVEAYGSPEAAAKAQGISLSDWSPAVGLDQSIGGFASYVGPTTAVGEPAHQPANVVSDQMAALYAANPWLRQQ